MIEFNNNNNIKKDIKANKSNKNIEKKHTLVMASILLYTILGFIAGLKINLFWILESVPFVSLIGLAYNCIDSLIINIKSECGFKNTCNLVDNLKRNNIKTTADNLIDSVIIEQSRKTIKETQDEDKINEELEKINDTYFLFLDNNSDIQGILERNIVVLNNDKKTEDKKYFILEQNEINVLEDRVSKVKKLVKVNDKGRNR